MRLTSDNDATGAMESGPGPNSNTDPLVSIVIPFYNDPYVGEAIESALAQTYRPLEIVVVDDGSTRFADRLERYAGAAERQADGGDEAETTSLRGVRLVIVRQANGGTARALNAGFRRASGAYVAWLSSDDRLRPDKIRRQLRFMQAARVPISHTAFAYMDESGRPDGEPVVLPSRSMTLLLRRWQRSNPVNGCTVMMEKRLFDRLGGFDERLSFTHDYDFWVRAALSGHAFGYVAEPLTDYRRHAAMGTIRHGYALVRELERQLARYRPRLLAKLRRLRPSPRPKPAPRPRRRGTRAAAPRRRGR